MDLYLVSGFLGSGKTTLIIRLSKMLMKMGKKVGVVTNDQGKYLVDTAFVNAEDIPAVDVQYGCFCTHYQDLIRQLEFLEEKINPDVIFAEAIGSSANLSGTVSEPLLQTGRFRAKALLGLADARLLLHRVRGESLPFSDHVRAVYDSQINESDYLIINKIDLLSESDLADLHLKLPQYFQVPEVQYISALNPADLPQCLRRISKIGGTALRQSPPPLEDKEAAFKNLKWYEKQFELCDDTDIHRLLVGKIDDMLKHFRESGYTVLRFKCIVKNDEGQVYTCDVSAADSDSWKSALNGLHGKSASLLINARLLHEDRL